MQHIKCLTEKKRGQLISAGKTYFACQICDKAYFSFLALKMHFKKSHPGDEAGVGDVFLCPFCNLTSENEFWQRNHRRVAHNGM